MKRLSLQWISLAAAAAVLAAGCAAVPQRTPEPNAGNNRSTTTGDADACAVALGNTVAPGNTVTRGTTVAPRNTLAPGNTAAPGGGMNGSNAVGGGTADRNGVAGVGVQEVTANGIIIGNVALVALPSADALPTTPATPTPTAPGDTTPAAPGGAPGPATTAPGATAPGATAPGATAPGAGATAAPAPLTGATAPPAPVVTAPAPAGNPNAAGAPGGVLDNRYTDPTPAGTAGATAGDGDAIARIKSACDKLADIRVVNHADDRARLARITAVMREGRPITEFMADLTRMAQGATSVGGGVNANQGPGPANEAPGAPRAGTPGAGVTGAPPANRPAVTPATPGMP